MVQSVPTYCFFYKDPFTNLPFWVSASHLYFDLFWYSYVGIPEGVDPDSLDSTAFQGSNVMLVFQGKLTLPETNSSPWKNPPC